MTTHTCREDGVLVHLTHIRHLQHCDWSRLKNVDLDLQIADGLAWVDVDDVLVETTPAREQLVVDQRVNNTRAGRNVDTQQEAVDVFVRPATHNKLSGE